MLREGLRALILLGAEHAFSARGSPLGFKRIQMATQVCRLLWSTDSVKVSFAGARRSDRVDVHPDESGQSRLLPCCRRRINSESCLLRGQARYQSHSLALSLALGDGLCPEPIPRPLKEKFRGRLDETESSDNDEYNSDATDGVVNRD